MPARKVQAKLEFEATQQLAEKGLGEQHQTLVAKNEPQARTVPLGEIWIWPMARPQSWLVVVVRGRGVEEGFVERQLPRSQGSLPRRG